MQISQPAPAGNRSQGNGYRSIAAKGSVTPHEREITLKEMYHITALPEQILGILVMEVEDADALARAEYVTPCP